MKTLIVNVKCENEGCTSWASGDPSFADIVAYGTTPDEARGRLIRSLYGKALLTEPVQLLFG